MHHALSRFGRPLALLLLSTCVALAARADTAQNAFRRLRGQIPYGLNLNRIFRLALLFPFFSVAAAVAAEPTQGGNELTLRKGPLEIRVRPAKVEMLDNGPSQLVLSASNVSDHAGGFIAKNVGMAGDVYCYDVASRCFVGRQPTEIEKPLSQLERDMREIAERENLRHLAPGRADSVRVNVKELIPDRPGEYRLYFAKRGCTNVLDEAPCVLVRSLRSDNPATATDAVRIAFVLWDGFTTNVLHALSNVLTHAESKRPELPKGVDVPALVLQGLLEKPCTLEKRSDLFFEEEKTILVLRCLRLLRDGRGSLDAATAAAVRDFVRRQRSFLAAFPTDEENRARWAELGYKPHGEWSQAAAAENLQKRLPPMWKAIKSSLQGAQ